MNKYTIITMTIATSLAAGLLISDIGHAQQPETGQSLRHDTSRPMRDIIAELGDLTPDPIGEVFEIPIYSQAPADSNRQQTAVCRRGSACSGAWRQWLAIADGRTVF